ncbi:HD domain-containing protein [Arthrobacter sp. LAPM80]|uniref:HD domain-containing protein n=1 Tax=Arthrobacter sp. LAPM80 TaxID=3141788 RepID=UPI00398B9A44
MGNNRDLIALACDVAAAAHAGQVDKVGASYIEHPARVAANVRLLFPHAPDAAVAVAWLHDVVEDTEIGFSDLRALGFSLDVMEGVDAMTKRNGERMEDYFARVRANPLARMVKAADLLDNTDPVRVARLDPATADRLRFKYARAAELLARL